MKEISALSTVLAVFLFLTSNGSFCQSKNVTIFGRVTELGSGESLAGAMVYVEKPQVVANTNPYGYFSLIVPTGKIRIRCTYPTYGSFDSLLTVRSDTVLNILLSFSTFDEVVVKAIPPAMPGGFLNIPVPRLRQVPSLLGEPDLIRALSYTPGISTGKEGSTGLYVRGGSPEQNLILLDEAPMYNTAHAFGFLSVFNPDAIKNIDIYKGGFPARYGGRVASVIDLTTLEGDREKRQGGWAVGLLNSRFLVQGPLVKGHSSFLIAGRSMNIWLLDKLRSAQAKMFGGSAVDFTDFWFYDANLRVNHTFKNQGQLQWSFYSNHDRQNNSYEYTYNAGRNSLSWGNLTSSLRYHQPLAPRLFWRSTAFVSRFNYGLTSVRRDDDLGFTSESRSRLDNSIQDLGARSSLDYFVARNYLLKTGGEVIRHRFFPGRVSFERTQRGETVRQLGVNTPIMTLELAGFVENDLRITPGLRLNAGLRYSWLRVDSVTYGNWEPRAALVWTVGERQSLKAGYSRMQQYLHQLTSNGAGFPNDLWVPVTAAVAPIRSDQFELGWSGRLSGHAQYELSVESYYKTIHNLIEYKYGSNVLTNFQQNWQETIFKNVHGRAYGLEVMLQRKATSLTGWVSYTYAKSLRQSPELNGGAWFPSSNDRPHNLALVGNYKYNDHWRFAANWIYMTGQPVTLPSGVFVNVEGWLQSYYVGRNQQRLPDFHRLDLGAIYTSINDRGWERSWSFGVYNAYNRRNPSYLVVDDTFKVVDGMQQQNGYRYQQRGLLPIMPYLSYQITY
jgi:outer membrane receptor for ferrienterochelin and colicin